MELTPQLLVAAYCQGAFPMARGRDSDEIDWFSPDPRGTLPLDRFRCPRSVTKVVRQGRFDIRTDTAFEQVMRCCAAPRRYEQETWINEALVAAYTHLHEAGLAHSVEAWRGGLLVGGLYGVGIGAAFFGESMFHLPGVGNDSSKVCLVALVEHLKRRGYELCDVQFNNPLLERFGAVEVDRADYMRRLEHAVRRDVTWADAPQKTSPA